MQTIGALYSVTVEIRALATEDAAAFQALRLEALRDSPTAFGSSCEAEAGRSLAEVAQRIRLSEDRAVFGAFSGGELVGVVGIYREQNAKERHKAGLWGMYVSPAARRQGLGRRLVRAALDFAAARPGVSQVRLQVVTANEAAVSLYRSLGFETYGVERDALVVDGAGYDEALMVCQVER